MFNVSTIKSANWHFTSVCNYHCTFCSTQKMQGDPDSIEVAEKVLTNLKRLGIEKVNFVGGEPLCNRLIYDAVRMAKEMGFVVSIVTNGALLNEARLVKLAPYVDWIGISVDSCYDEVEAAMGRGRGRHVTHALEMAPLIRAHGIKLKINTTVTKLTCGEDMTGLIREFAPDRWKVFQFMHVPGQNDHAVNELGVTSEEFEVFQRRHEGMVMKNGVRPVFETDEMMRESYLMVGPSGNVFMNNQYPAKEYDIKAVTPEIIYAIINREMYASRGAIYNWL